MAISKRTRFEVMRRDGNRCIYCGATAKETQLTIDHVIPIALGGTDDLTNLVTACTPCNSGKTSVNADEEFVARVDDDTARWRRAMAVAARIRRDESDTRAEELAQLEIAWHKWTYKADESPIPLPEDWTIGAEGMLVAGLPIEEMLRLIPVAMRANLRTNMDVPEWRYFMGCCKRVLRDIETTARSLIDSRDTAARAEIDAAAPEPAVEPGITDERRERAPTLEDLP